MTDPKKKKPKEPKIIWSDDWNPISVPLSELQVEGADGVKREWNGKEWVDPISDIDPDKAGA